MAKWQGLGRGWSRGQNSVPAGAPAQHKPGDSRVSQRALGCAVKKVRPSRPDGASVAPEPPSGLRLRVREGIVLPLGPPRSHLQEEAGLPELPEVAVAVALARVMVRGPVFAAHVEDEWVANAGRKAIRAVREGVRGGLLTCLNLRFWNTSGDVPAPTYLITPVCVSPALRSNMGHWLCQRRRHKARDRLQDRQ